MTAIKSIREVTLVNFVSGNNVPSACPLCYDSTAGGGQRGRLCGTCLDLLEFGYASFPSYPLARPEDEDAAVSPSAEGKC
ncbi:MULTISPECIES: hypothetical protein [Paenibacillus]|uniref:hypothetical protein n=1 Tax=Paenibacillus TaxID=44249 RepID=UPI0022B8A3FB|nr:hypothetical protein [Paenibacillus caseinilyticus]MCZ8520815.1 hypothetical protein [Paenibacillus caseinilyticus]